MLITHGRKGNWVLGIGIRSQSCRAAATSLSHTSPEEVKAEPAIKEIDTSLLQTQISSDLKDMKNLPT